MSHPDSPSTRGRRAFLSGFLRGEAPEPPRPRRREGLPVARDRPLALILPDHCLSYRNQVCTSCLERCPEPGAIKLDGVHPRVIPDACTGCGQCHDVCPAPQNAVLVLPGAPSQRRDRRR